MTPALTLAQDTQPDIGSQAGNVGNALADGDISAAASGATDLLSTYGIPALIAIAILIGAFFIGKFLGRIISAPIIKRVDETLGKFIAKLVFYLIMIVAIIAVLGRFGIEVTAFAAILAAAGFAVGLAFQGTLSSFAAGVMLLVFRPFKVGDVCVIAGETVKIDAIDLFTTLANTLDNRRIIFPNADVFGSQIEVITYHPQRRVSVDVGAAYDADINATRAALEDAIAATEGVLADPESKVVLQGLGGSSVDWTCMAWANAADFLAVKQALTQNIKEKLDAAGIGIPFPQMDVHLDGQVHNTQG
ncbi:MAG: mechanosensitive ion channel domain-containing protein [Planctomycetota bacterium]